MFFTTNADNDVTKLTEMMAYLNTSAAKFSRAPNDDWRLECGKSAATYAIIFFNH